MNLKTLTTAGLFSMMCLGCNSPIDRCSTSIKHDDIVINLPMPHPSSLSIKTPKQGWFVIQDESIDLYYLPQDSFEKHKCLIFNKSSLMGTRFINGAMNRYPVFEDSGDYLFYFADNLETEPENTFHFERIITIE